MDSWERKSSSLHTFFEALIRVAKLYVIFPIKKMPFYCHVIVFTVSHCIGISFFKINIILNLETISFFAITSNAVETSWTWLITFAGRTEWAYRIRVDNLNKTHAHNFLMSLKCCSNLPSLWRWLIICKAHFWPHRLLTLHVSCRISLWISLKFPPPS